jgi:hypothetical protein
MILIKLRLENKKWVVFKNNSILGTVEVINNGVKFNHINNLKDRIEILESLKNIKEI